MEPPLESKSAQPAPNPASAQTTPLPPPRRRRVIRPAYLIIGIVILALIAWAVVYYERYVVPFETTDDAFIAAHWTYVSPRVPGQIVKLLVDDNQRVKAGDVLAEIDPADYEAQRAQARADLAVAKAHVAQAKAQIAVDDAKVEEQKAAVTSAQALAGRAKADLDRYQSAPEQAVSRTVFDAARTQASSSSANVDVAQSLEKAAEAQLEPDRAAIEAANAQEQQAEARLQLAELNLSYTKIAAPKDGRVTRRTVEQGAYVQAGQALLALVPDEVWVVANFKETQLARIRAGQTVEFTIDALGDQVFHGKVDSIQSGTGAEFSLLPPENAVGNYVKVVQRAPVKIVFDQPVNQSEGIVAPGMSVEPKVRVK